MVKNNRLAPILNQYKELELGPDQLSALEMGYIYEELLRRFSEQSGEEAGEHFTPREVIRLMVELLEIPIPDRHFSIYDPACGTGGMLSVAKEHLLDRAATPEEKERVEKFVTVHGQELSPTNYAICQADLLIKNDQQAKVFLGNSLIPHDPHSKEPGDQWPETKFRFDRMLSNPPFGVTWGGKDGYETEARKLEKTRYQAGMPRVNDGALLFLQTMLAKMNPPEEGGSRIAIIFNGSPLSNGDCGSGESEIRRWILENDWLDAIVMLPDQLFYNTGIFTYIWLLRNDKPASHRGRVMLIDARKQFEKEPKSFGNKRNRMTDAHRAWIEERYRDGWAKGYADEQVKIFRREDFAYHKVSVVFWQTDEHDKPAIVTEPYEKAFTGANLKKEQEFYDSDLTFRVKIKTAEGEKIETMLFTPKDDTIKKFKTLMEGKPEIVSVEWTHRPALDVAGLFTQKDAADFSKLVANGTDAQVQFFVNALRTRFQAKIADTEERKAFVYLLARYVKVFHFLTCFFTYAPELKEFATFAEYVGPQLIKQGSVSDLMKQIRQTEVIKAAVEYQGVTTSAGPVKLKPSKGKKGTGPPPKKVSVQDMIDEIRAKFDITDEEALYIKQVTEEKVRRPGHPHHRPRPPRRPRLPRRRVSRPGQRRDSDGLRRAWTLRGIGRSQIHGHRRHLRHHGRDGDPDAPVVRGLKHEQADPPDPRRRTAREKSCSAKGREP